MGFFDFLRGDARDTAQPELSVQSVGELSDKVAGNPITNRDMLLAQLLQQEKLLNKANQDFKKEEDRVNSLPAPQNQEDYITRNSKLASIRENMTNYQNKIRDLLRDNNVSPNNLPDIYNFYVDGREVADENYSSQRENALSQYLNDPDAFNKEPNLPTASQMEEEYSNRRRNKLDDNLEVPIDAQGDVDEGDKNLERRGKRQGNIDEADLNAQRRKKRQSGDPNLLNDYDNQQLKAYKEDLTEQLKNDPKNQAIKDELGAIQNKQNERAKDLEQSLKAEPPPEQRQIVATTGQSKETQ